MEIRIEKSMTRWLSGYTLKERKKSAEIRGLSGLEPVSLVIMKGRLRWFWDGAHKVTLCMIICVHTVDESLRLSGRVCLSHSAALAIHASWLQTLSSARSTGSDSTTDSVWLLTASSSIVYTGYFCHWRGAAMGSVVKVMLLHPDSLIWVWFYFLPSHTIQYDTNLYGAQGHVWIRGAAWLWTTWQRTMWSFSGIWRRWVGDWK